VFNEPVQRPDGSLIAIADAWWPGERVAAEVDSREWHLSPADWEETMRRHNEMERHGIRVLHFQSRADPPRAPLGDLGHRGSPAAGGTAGGGSRVRHLPIDSHP
jgi:hypothetical protein